MDIKQNADGSMAIINPLDSSEVLRVGGPKAATQNSPIYKNTSALKLAVAGTADTAGALLSWQNNLGYDIIVIGAVLDVTTQSSGACTVSLGQTPTNGTTLSSNMISGQSVASAGQFKNAAPLGVKVPNGTWITGSTASGASAALVGSFYMPYFPV